MKYFITFNGQTIGPMTVDQLFAYPIDPNTPVCTDEDRTWKPLYTFPDLMTILANNRNTNAVSPSGKDKLICGLLAIFIGWLGIQYFYIGKTQAGIITIILSLVTCGLWQIVTFIQGILMLAMTQAQFEEKYVLSPSKFPVF